MLRLFRRLFQSFRFGKGERPLADGSIIGRQRAREEVEQRFYELHRQELNERFVALARPLQSHMLR